MVKRRKTYIPTVDTPEFLDELRDLESGLRINEHALEEALQQQPDFFYRVSKHLTWLVSLRDGAKQNLQEVEARVDIALRNQAKEENLKTSEKSLESERRTDPDVEAAAEEYLSLCNAVGQYTALKEAFIQRSYVLKELVALYLSNYYAESDSQSTRRRVRDDNAAEAREAMNRKRRN